MADAIGEGRRPQGMSEDEQVVYDFTVELQGTRHVSDDTFARASRRFGSQGVVDMTAISGYCTLLAMELNMARYAVPPDGPRLPGLVK